MQVQPLVFDKIREVANELLHELGLIAGDPRKSALAEDSFPLVKNALDRCVAELRLFNLWGPENRLPSSELWNVAGHLLERGWLQNRARTKPRGYAGDYEMLARIYENRLCDDPLGRLFDRYFQEEAAPRAVRHRMQMMADWIVEQVNLECQPSEDVAQFRIAIFGSAFGLEIRDALLRLDPPTRDRLHVTLLDLDPEAIALAQQRLTPLLRPEQLTAAAANLFRLPDRPHIAALIDRADLLFCPGLFDYLDDAAAIAMLRALVQRLAPGGRLTVFQFAPHNPTRAYMEWLANWYLIYRDGKQFRALVQAADVAADEIQFGAEPLGVDLYVTIRRGAEGIVEKQ
jgi:extracellular factor (EF) 3-hydroxypalmitic acid methyl ester biosynthesis protein